MTYRNNTKGRPPVVSVPFRHSWCKPFEAEKERIKRLVRRTGNPSTSYEELCEQIFPYQLAILVNLLQGISSRQLQVRLYWAI